MSDLNKRCIDSWRTMMPDYQIKEWNETNSPLDNRYCQAAYARKSWSRLSNHVRLHALYMEGGIYLDTDVEVIKSFTPLLQHECFLGFQQEEEQVDWLNSAVLGAHGGHQFLSECMELTRKQFAETGTFPRSPTVVTMILKAMGLKEYGLQEIKGVTVYPAEFFYPYPWFSKFSTDCITENTNCIHYWEHTWQEAARPKVSWRRIVERMKRTILPKSLMRSRGRNSA